MRNDDMPAAVRQYVNVMRFLGVLYAIAGLIFFFFPKFVFTLLNIIPSIVPMAQLPPSTEHFWLPLATSMMAMLTFLCFAAAVAPENRTYAWVHFVAKVVSSAGYLYYFVNFPIENKFVFAYLVGVLTDAPIALLVLFMTVRASFALGRAQSSRSGRRNAAVVSAEPGDESGEPAK